MNVVTEYLKSIKHINLLPDSSAAMVAPFGAIQNQKEGGINLNPANLNLQIDRDPNAGMVKPLSPEALQNIHVNGFVPVIINITPVKDPRLLLGL